MNWIRKTIHYVRMQGYVLDSEVPAFAGLVVFTLGTLIGAAFIYLLNKVLP